MNKGARTLHMSVRASEHQNPLAKSEGNSPVTRVCGTGEQSSQTSTKLYKACLLKRA